MYSWDIIVSELMWKNQIFTVYVELAKIKIVSPLCTKLELWPISKRIDWIWGNIPECTLCLLLCLLVFFGCFRVWKNVNLLSQVTIVQLKLREINFLQSQFKPISLKWLFFPKFTSEESEFLFFHHCVVVGKRMIFSHNELWEKFSWFLRSWGYSQIGP